MTKKTIQNSRGLAVRCGLSLTLLAAVLATPVLAHPAPAGAAPSAPAAAAFSEPAATGRQVSDVVILPGQALGAVPYQPLATYLKVKGLRVSVLDLVGDDLDAEARVIGREVDSILARNPRATIGLVGHSIGGLNSRWYLKHYRGHEKVATYISIGSPQYGSPGACGFPIGEMACPGSDFLAELNAGDDTPGNTFYVALRGQREWVDSKLDGGQCRATPVPGYDAVLPDLGLDHTGEPFDPRFWGQVEQALSGKCPGSFVNDTDGVLTAESSLYPNGKPSTAWNPADLVPDWLAPQH